MPQSRQCEKLWGKHSIQDVEIQKPAAMRQKHRYDLNDLYAVFLEYWDSADSQPQRGLIVLCAFCKGFPDTHTHTYSDVGA